MVAKKKKTHSTSEGKYPNGKHPNSLKNLQPFKPGAEWEGNAEGRPAGSSVIEHVRDKLRLDPAIADALADRLIEMAKENIPGMRELLDRTDGKVKDKIDVNAKIIGVLTYKQLVEEAMQGKKEKEGR